MKNKTLLMKTIKTGLSVGALIIASLAVPSVRGDDLHVGVTVPVPSVNVQVGAPDDYVYYPKYGAYYSPIHHRYYYQDHGCAAISKGLGAPARRTPESVNQQTGKRRAWGPAASPFFNFIPGIAGPRGAGKFRPRLIAVHGGCRIPQYARRR
jgi:hypothetical protein